MSEENKEEVSSEETETTVVENSKNTENVEEETAQENTSEETAEVNLVQFEKISKKAILGKKVGMTQIWDENDKVIPVTVVHAPANVVSQIKTLEKDGYCAIQIAAQTTKEQRLSKSEKGHLIKANAGFKKTLTEIRLPSNTAETDGVELGQVINVEAFSVGDSVDVVGTSKGHGFSGGMKRHNFSGQNATHGNHRAHRKPGSIGACATPARVFKGKKMAGQYGNVRVTVQNLEVVGVDLEKEVLLIKGAIPGVKGSNVTVQQAVKFRVKA
jgi:large subunit ribosomal protein L3